MRYNMYLVPNCSSSALSSTYEYNVMYLKPIPDAMNYVQLPYPCMVLHMPLYDGCKLLSLIVVVVVLTLTRIITSVVTGQAPVTLELRNTPGKNTLIAAYHRLPDVVVRNLKTIKI